MNMNLRITRIAFSTVVLLSVSLFLSGCYGKTELTVNFLADEAWEAKISFFGEQGVFDSEDELEIALAEAADHYRAEGIDMAWNRREDGDLTVLSVYLNGQGYDLLNETVFDNVAVIDVRMVDGERQIDFKVEVFDSGGPDMTLTLVGGEIVSSNGNEIERGKVRWESTSSQFTGVLEGGEIRALMTEMGSNSGNNLFPTIAIGAFLFLAALAMIVFYRQGRQPATSIAPSQATKE